MLTRFIINFIYRFDAIVSADAFENLKPAPDIFFAASKILNIPPNEVCIFLACIFHVISLTLLLMYYLDIHLC